MKKGFVYVIITAVLFTTLEPLGKLISGEVSPLVITFVRFFLGGLVLLPFAALEIKRRKIRLGAADFAKIALLGVLCVCVSMLLLQFAVQKAASPALVAIIFSSNSVFTVLFSALINREKITPEKAAAVLVCAAGLPVGADFAKISFVSFALTVAAAATFSLYSVLTKRFMCRIGAVVQTGFSFVFGSAVLFVLLVALRIPFAFNFSAKNISVLLFLGIALTGAGYWSYFRAMEKISAIGASFVFFIKPVLTPFAMLLINGILPDARVFVSMAFVVCGSVILTRDRMRAKKTGPPE